MSNEAKLLVIVRELDRKCPIFGRVVAHPVALARLCYRFVSWRRRAWWQLTNHMWRALVRVERMDARRGKARELTGSENAFRGLDR